MPVAFLIKLLNGFFPTVRERIKGDHQSLALIITLGKMKLEEKSSQVMPRATFFNAEMLITEY